MKSKTIAAAGVSAAALGLMFGASAAQAATLSPLVEKPTIFQGVVVADINSNNNNNNNQKPKAMLAAAKPAALGMLASELT